MIVWLGSNLFNAIKPRYSAIKTNGAALKSRYKSSNCWRQSKTSSAAYCANVGGDTNRFCAKHSTGRSKFSGKTIHPKRHPVMQKYLEKLLIMRNENESNSLVLISIMVLLFIVLFSYIVGYETMNKIDKIFIIFLVIYSIIVLMIAVIKGSFNIRRLL